MKTKILSLIFVIIFVFSLVACGDGADGTTNNNGGTNSPNATKYNYDLTKYVTLPKYKGETIEIDGDFLQQTIDTVVQNYATPKKAEAGMDIYVDLKFTELKYLDVDQTIDQKGEVIESLGKTNFLIGDFGSGKYNNTLEELVLTWNPLITKPQEKMVTLPDEDMFGEYAGKKVYFSFCYSNDECRLGDVVKVDYTGYYSDENGNIKLNEKGEKMAFDASKDATFYLGSHLAIDDFENGIVGMRIGEANKKQIYATFPADYGVEALNGKKVIFEIVLKEIYTAPEYNDELIKKMGYETTKEFEDTVIAEALNENLYKYLIEKSVVISYPELEYKDYENFLKKLDESYMKTYGYTFEAYLNGVLGKTKDQYIKEVMLPELVHYAIAQAEDLVPTEDQIKEAREKLCNEFALEYMKLNTSLTYEQAYVMGEEYVNKNVAYADIHQDALYTLVESFVKENCRVKVTEPTYESVTNKK